MYDQVFSVELNLSALGEVDASKAGLRPVKDWRAFGLKGYSGIANSKKSITFIQLKTPKVLVLKFCLHADTHACIDIQCWVIVQCQIRF